VVVKDGEKKEKLTGQGKVAGETLQPGGNGKVDRGMSGGEVEQSVESPSKTKNGPLRKEKAKDGRERRQGLCNHYHGNTVTPCKGLGT